MARPMWKEREITDAERQQLVERVDRGVQIMDWLYPDWPLVLDSTDLDMADSCRCVLGQYFGDYTDGIEKIAEVLEERSDVGKLRELAGYTLEDTEISGLHNGFDAAVGSADGEWDIGNSYYAALREEWIKRRDARLKKILPANE